MRTYALVCPCGWKGEIVANWSDRDGLRCPKCKADNRLETDFDALRVASTIEYGNGAGVPLLSEGCHPSEVEKYRKACPNLDVKPDGTFWTRNRSHTRQVLAEIQAFRGT